MARTKVDTNKVSEDTVVAEVTSPVKNKIPMNYLVPVKSNVQGKLIYISKSGVCSEEWGELGEIIYMELEELNRMRNTQKGFFEDNMILFEDTDEYTAEDFYKALRVEKYYQNISVFSSLDDVFNLSVANISRIVPNLSRGYKSNIGAMAVQLIKDKDKRMDSVAKIKAFEKALGIDLGESR